MKKVLIINGNPDKESLCFELTESYKNGADNVGAECNVIHLTDLDFDPVLKFGYRIKPELEPDLVHAQNQIMEADHLVFVYPTWWGTYPALLKGFIDRVFMPKFAFKYREGSLFWDKLLTGKTARLIVTMDTPKWYYSINYKSPGHNSMKKGILNFCGVKPVRISTFGPVKSAKEEKVKSWKDKIYKLGQTQK